MSGVLRRYPFALVAACMALLACLLLASCSGGSNRVQTGDATGVLHFGNGTEPQGIDPHITTGVPESHIVQALLEGLVVKNPETLAPEPGVAESWEISPRRPHLSLPSARQCALVRWQAAYGRGFPLELVARAAAGPRQ